MQPTSSRPTQMIACSQCGGELHPDEGQMFLTCPFCSATVYLDKSRVVFHWILTPTLNDEQARASLARWMAGNETVKDLDKKSRVVSQAFQYFPVWYFKSRTGDGKGEEIRLAPAAATSITEVRHLKLPAGDLRKYDPAFDAQCVEPTVPLDTALGWSLPAGGEGSAPAAVPQALETALVHIPVYTFKYVFGKHTYTALVEAGTGATLANIYPAKSESPFILAGGLSAFVFLCLASFPVLGGLIEGEAGLAVGVGLFLALLLLAIPALFALAVWVAAKV